MHRSMDAGGQCRCDRFYSTIVELIVGLAQNDPKNSHLLLELKRHILINLLLTYTIAKVW